MNPLQIFTKEELKSLDAVNLRHYRKKYLGHFQFSDEDTIEILRTDYTENQIKSIFESLEANLDIYKFLGVNYPALLSYLQTQNINEIRKLSLNDLKGELNDISRIKILDLLSKSMGERLLFHYIYLDFDHSEVDDIYEFCLNQDTSFLVNTYSEFQKIFTVDIYRFVEDSKAPLIENTNKFKESIVALGHVQVYTLLIKYPDNFKPLLEKYFKACQDIIIFSSLKLGNAITLSKSTLDTMIQLAMINDTYNNSSESKKYLESFKNLQSKYLIKGESKNTSSSIWGVIVTIFIIIRIIKLIVDLN